MILGRRRGGGASSVRLRFGLVGRRRVVTVEGAGLPEVERRRLRRLLRPLRLQSGSVTIRTDWTGRRRVTFSREIPEPTQQIIRNLVGNLTHMRAL